MCRKSVRAFGLPFFSFLRKSGLGDPISVLSKGHCLGVPTLGCARCNSSILYTITSMEAAQYNCPDAPSNESSAERRATSGTKQGMAQKGSVLQFTGRQCGYDSRFEPPFLRLAEETKVSKILSAATPWTVWI